MTAWYLAGQYNVPAGLGKQVYSTKKSSGAVRNILHFQLQRSRMLVNFKTSASSAYLALLS